MLREGLSILSDFRYIYKSASGIADQQGLLSEKFDHRLYYRQGFYQRPYMTNIFRNSILRLSDKKLLEVDGNREAGLVVRLIKCNSHYLI